MVRADEAAALANRASPIRQATRVDTSEISETRFDGPRAVRGKYHAAFLECSGLIALDPDVRLAFKDSASVNRALRRVIALAAEIVEDTGRASKASGSTTKRR